MPDWRMGAVIMKMMSSTRTTSTSGTIFISESDVSVCRETCGMGLRTPQALIFSICAATSMEKLSMRAARSFVRCTN